ncbi:hypothetical protein [Streptomyces chartreusis]|uniref:hypothetical protein n=1 Tax=Streptomyces chartreusis TaxID=1969 RepID=UPI0033A16246
MTQADHELTCTYGGRGGLIKRQEAGLAFRTALAVDTPEIEVISETQRLLERIPKPVTDDEAQALATLFGPDNCFGLAWTLLHLIETAPGARLRPVHGANRQ